MSHYTVQARNFSESSENKIHSDEIAKKFGFTGALVPGVAVYGHLVYPLVDKFGKDWLAHSVDDLRLIKPAYHGDLLTCALDSVDDNHTVSCRNTRGDLLATLVSQAPDNLPTHEVPTKTSVTPADRIEIAWDNVIEGQAFAPWQVVLDEAENQRYTTEVDDHCGHYTEGLIHPHFVLSLANTALMNEYIMPTWIHVGSQTTRRAPLYVGDTVDIKSTTEQRWQKKGHEFIRIHIEFWRGDTLTTDIKHTAIFKVAA